MWYQATCLWLAIILCCMMLCLLYLGVAFICVGVEKLLLMYRYLKKME